MNWFTVEGRIGRQSLILRRIGIVLGFLAACFVAGGVFGLMSGPNVPQDTIQGVVGLLLIPFGILDLLQVAKRCHDLNISAWFGLITLIPFVGVLFGLYLLFVKGVAGHNQYGADPLSPVSVMQNVYTPTIA